MPITGCGGWFLGIQKLGASDFIFPWLLKIQAFLISNPT